MEQITYPIGPGYMGLDGKYHHKDGSLWTEEELRLQSEAISLKYNKLRTLTIEIKVSDFGKLESSWDFIGSKWQNKETEISAWWLIEFAKTRGSFDPFKLEELQSYYEKELGKKEEFRFNYLTSDEDILVDHDTEVTVYYTDSFISHCHELLLKNKK